MLSVVFSLVYRTAELSALPTEEVALILTMSSEESDIEDFDDRRSPISGDIAPYQFEPRQVPRDTQTHADENRQPDSSDSESDTTRIGNTDWCTCGSCVPMPTEVESRCCKEIPRIAEKMKEEDAQCITIHPGFEGVCLNPYVLEVAYYQYTDEHPRGDTQDTPHERMRYVAYRQLVRWCWHILGRKIRHPLPSCAVARIRAQFPEGDRVGFKWADD